MLQNTYKPKPNTRAFWQNLKIPQVPKDQRLLLTIGFTCQAIALFLVIAFVSHFCYSQQDQSIIGIAYTKGLKLSGAMVKNWCSVFGAIAAYYFIYQGFGITAFFIPWLLYWIGHWLIYSRAWHRPYRSFSFAGVCMVWTNITLGYLHHHHWLGQSLIPMLGNLGIRANAYLYDLFGEGVVILLVLCLIIACICWFNITAMQLPPYPRWLFLRKKPVTAIEANISAAKDKDTNITTAPSNSNDSSALNHSNHTNNYNPAPTSTAPLAHALDLEELPMTNTQGLDTLYDSTLDLADYKYPHLNLLKLREQTKIPLSRDELKQNEEKIIETLTNFKIGISNIKATIGPTVTLYEIVPEAGVKIARIKSLEDDIALSLSALGIRIIAPMPGKGTIGIEVPNKNRELVSFRSLMHLEKNNKTPYELPIILGKTITNELYITDLSRMPHLLIAGATGQGKSVGLNVILASLLYKKHPSQLKLVLVDPKKVELSLYAQIEKHFLAKLPNNTQAIITETKTVIHTLRSLCIEMDMRYELLKQAGTRTIKEYNEKFINRTLNPKQGHRFLPYIVLVIDEFADLIMTAGKEIETPIARLAQLARAVGIHLVLATQRPSVNVITGIIKANFPVRIAFRVISSIDSRTILDSPGAERLIGDGDLLISKNSELLRVQCALLDTSEIQNLCHYITQQQSYPSAYELPHYQEEDEEISLAKLESNKTAKDPLLKDAAKIILAYKKASASLIQIRLSVGYNRAVRLLELLEELGIVGPFVSGKPREIRITQEQELEAIFHDIEQVRATENIPT